MVADIDIYRAAKLLIDHHGKHALAEAALRCDDLENAGEKNGADVWRRIANAVADLQMAVASPNTSFH